MDQKKDFSFPQEQIASELSEREWQILEAAIKVFSEKGYDASRTSEIAKEAEVAEGTIFRYFKTKKDLLVGLLVPFFKFFKPFLFGSVEKIMQKQQPIEKTFAEILMDRLQLARKNLPLIKTVVVEALYHQELLKPLQTELIPSIAKLLDSFIAENIENGTLRDLSPRLVSRSVMSLLAGYLILSSVAPDTFKLGTDEKEIESIVDILLNGIKNDHSS